MENKHTAVEWLLQQMDLETISKYDKQLLQAKAMEKEQIIKANEDCSSNELGELLTGEQYYNETYENNEKRNRN